jgi:hypothetical protein
LKIRKEIIWGFKNAVEDSTEGHGRCTRRLVQIVRKNAKSLSSQAETVLYTAKNVSQSVKIAAVKRSVNWRKE